MSSPFNGRVGRRIPISPSPSNHPPHTHPASRGLSVLDDDEEESNRLTSTIENTTSSFRLGSAFPERFANEEHRASRDDGFVRPKTPLSTSVSRKRSERASPTGEGVGEQPTKKPRKTTAKPAGIRQRKAPEKPIAEHAPIPHTLAQCSTADKYLWTQRDAGKTFVSILPQYEALAGTRVAPSTLPNRYKRMHDNFGIFDQEMDDLLLECKRKIEDVFETEKWVMMKELMISKGGKVMKPEALEKRAMQLALQAEDGEAEMEGEPMYLEGRHDY